MLSNNTIARARSTEEYVDMIKQAIEFDEYMNDARDFADDLETILKGIYTSMEDGTYQFATGDLPYVQLMEKYHEALIPYKYLLKRINETHHKGLQV